MLFSTPYEWLQWITAQHPKEIDLGLQRVAEVAQRLGLIGLVKPNVPIITIAGTNGKGTTVAALESIYLRAGYSVGTFTSPYLFEPNEQIKINGFAISDGLFCEALSVVDEARDEVPLSVFEFQTLAALWIFTYAPIEVWLLEVGLGGRLDAVNIIDADVAIVTSIDLDHMQYLGQTREAIAIEKAGIFRHRALAICGDPNPPKTLKATAQAVGSRWVGIHEAFDYRVEKVNWHWNTYDNHYTHLPKTHYLPQNLASALMAVSALRKRLPVLVNHVQAGLQEMHVPARLEQIQTETGCEIHDVGHNPAAVRLLANTLQTTPVAGKTHAVFSMLADKDIFASIQAIKDYIDLWYVAPVKHARGANLAALRDVFKQARIARVQFFPTIEEAYTQANCAIAERLVIFGSFHTVAEVRKACATR